VLDNETADDKVTGPATVKDEARVVADPTLSVLASTTELDTATAPEIVAAPPTLRVAVVKEPCMVADPETVSVLEATKADDTVKLWPTVDAPAIDTPPATLSELPKVT
jgi:hypothetical protein